LPCPTRGIGGTELKQNELVVLAVGDRRANMEGVGCGKDYLLDVRLAAAATFPDEVTELESAGVDVARTLHAEVGQGLAHDPVTCSTGNDRTERSAANLWMAA